MKYLLSLEETAKEIVGHIREGDKYKSFAITPSDAPCILAQCRVREFRGDQHFLESAVKVTRGALFFPNPLPVEDLQYDRLAEIWRKGKEG